MSEYYVYCYFDPRTDPPVPIYVGKGKGKRWKHHLKPSCENIILKSKIAHMKELGLAPIIEILNSGLTNEEAISLEADLILKYGRVNNESGTLCNFTDGGFGTDGYKHRPETIEKFVGQRKGKGQTEAQYRANCSRKQSAESRAKISQSLKGISTWTEERRLKHIANTTGSRRSEETKIKMSEQRKGKKQTPAQYAANCNRAPKTKRVRCLDNGVIYDSCKAAKIGLNLKGHHNAIGAVCAGTRSQHRGFHFEYVT